MVVEKGSGDLTREFGCDEIPIFCGVLIAGDKPKKGANIGLRKLLNKIRSYLFNSLRNPTSR